MTELDSVMKNSARRTTACRLCGDVGTHLESHIIPRWVYRRLSRLNPGRSGSNPVHVGGGRTMLRATQLKEYLLCERCEALMKRWEDCVAGLSLQENDRFPALEAVTPFIGKADDPFVLADASMLDIEKIVRFGVSVIWRASVSSKVPGVKLGRYADALAAYLRDDVAQLPPDARLRLVFICPMSELRFDRTVCEPYTHRDDAHLVRIHSFYLFGMWFHLHVGCEDPSPVDMLCLATERKVTISDGARLSEISATFHAENPPVGTIATPECLADFAKLARGRRSR